VASFVCPSAISCTGCRIVCVLFDPSFFFRPWVATIGFSCPIVFLSDADISVISSWVRSQMTSHYCDVWDKGVRRKVLYYCDVTPGSVWHSFHPLVHLVESWVDQAIDSFMRVCTSSPNVGSATSSISTCPSCRDRSGMSTPSCVGQQAGWTSVQIGNDPTHKLFIASDYFFYRLLIYWLAYTILCFLSVCWVKWCIFALHWIWFLRILCCIRLSFCAGMILLEELVDVVLYVTSHWFVFKFSFKCWRLITVGWPTMLFLFTLRQNKRSHFCLCDVSSA